MEVMCIAIAEAGFIPITLPSKASHELEKLKLKSWVTCRTPSPTFSPKRNSSQAARGDSYEEATNENVKSKGQKSARRRRKGKRQQEHRCRRCGRMGHNVRRCPQQPVNSFILNSDRNIISNDKSILTEGRKSAGRSNVKAAASNAGLKNTYRRRIRGRVEPILGGGAWFPQRCGKCGEVGHNIRNCSELRREGCAVCDGSGKLQCGKCDGRGYIGEFHGIDVEEEETEVGEDVERRWGEAEMERRRGTGKGGRGGGRASGGVGGLSPEMRVRVEAVRARARGVVQIMKEGRMDYGDEDLLVGGKENGETTRRRVASFSQMEFKQRERNSRCPRCQGTGYLSCLACSD